MLVPQIYKIKVFKNPKNIRIYVLATLHRRKFDYLNRRRGLQFYYFIFVEGLASTPLPSIFYNYKLFK